MGRPRKESRIPNGPFFLLDLGSKVRVTVAMEGPVEAEMKAYLKFCANVSGLDDETVENRFMSTIIKDAIRKDKFYQARHNKPENSIDSENSEPKE